MLQYSQKGMKRAKAKLEYEVFLAMTRHGNCILKFFKEVVKHSHVKHFRESFYLSQPQICCSVQQRVQSLLPRVH